MVEVAQGGEDNRVIGKERVGSEVLGLCEEILGDRVGNTVGVRREVGERLLALLELGREILEVGVETFGVETVAFGFETGGLGVEMGMLLGVEDETRRELVEIETLFEMEVLFDVERLNVDRTELRELLVALPEADGIGGVDEVGRELSGAKSV